MSPGATFERVYHELKQQLASGQLPPGTPLEPTQLGQQLAASITPVRDALHRLVGEQLVDAPNHNGFLVPRPSEAGLRDLYAWNGRIVALATTGLKTTSVALPNRPQPAPDNIPAATAQLFHEMAAQAQSGEHLRAVIRLNDRLTIFRHAETHTLENMPEEFAALASAFTSGDRAPLRLALNRYHRRRTLAVQRIIASVEKSTRA